MNLEFCLIPVSPLSVSQSVPARAGALDLSTQASCCDAEPPD